MVLNWVFRWLLLGPLIRLFFQVHVVGKEHLPKHGPFILAIGPHRSEFESLVVASYLRRYWLRFFAKQEYWDKHKLLGHVMTWIGLVPLPRGLGRAMLAQIEQGVDVLKKGGVLALYIEATRSKDPSDDAMHRGYPGFAYSSLRAGGVPVVPVGMIGMRKLNPPGKGLHPGRATIVIGEPIYPMALRSPEEHGLAEKALERVLIKPLVTKVSREIARLSTSRYDDKELPIPES